MNSDERVSNSANEESDKKSLQDTFERCLGKRLKIARVASELTQQDVADALGTSKQSISYIENNPQSQGVIVDYLIFLRKQGIDLNQLLES